MRAEERRYTVDVRFSERDSKDGFSLTADYRRVRVETVNDGADIEPDLDTFGKVLSGGAGKLVASATATGTLFASDAIKTTANTLAEPEEGGTYDVTYTVTTGSTLVYEGDWSGLYSEELGLKNYVVTLSINYDKSTAGEELGTGGDDIDDRDQVIIPVYLQSSIGSSYNLPVKYYVANVNDDVAKLVTNGDYDGFPGWDEVAYDAEDNEYYYEFTEKDGAYYGELVKGEEPSFTKSTSTNDKDTNGDGKVSCDEYYGTTGLEWSDKLNACVVSSTGDAVVTIPNTATK